MINDMLCIIPCERLLFSHRFLRIRPRLHIRHVHHLRIHLQSGRCLKPHGDLHTHDFQQYKNLTSVSTTSSSASPTAKVSSTAAAATCGTESFILRFVKRFSHFNINSLSLTSVVHGNSVHLFSGKRFPDFTVVTVHCVILLNWKKGRKEH